MICETPITRGPNKGKPATGTSAGYRRHLDAGEQACAACRAGHSRASYESAKRNRKPKPMKYKLTGPQPVVCACGRRGVANMALVGRARKVEQCAECR